MGNAYEWGEEEIMFDPEAFQASLESFADSPFPATTPDGSEGWDVSHQAPGGGGTFGAMTLNDVYVPEDGSGVELTRDPSSAPYSPEEQYALFGSMPDLRPTSTTVEAPSGAAANLPSGGIDLDGDGILDRVEGVSTPGATGPNAAVAPAGWLDNFTRTVSGLLGVATGYEQYQYNKDKARGATADGMSPDSVNSPLLKVQEAINSLGGRLQTTLASVGSRFGEQAPTTTVQRQQVAPPQGTAPTPKVPPAESGLIFGQSPVTLALIAAVLGLAYREYQKQQQM